LALEPRLWAPPMADAPAEVLHFLLLGSRGGRNRARILGLLAEGPRNAHRIAKDLLLNYGTVASHLRVLVKFSLIVPIGIGRYGRGYALSPALSRDRALVESLSRPAEIGRAPRTLSMR